MSGPAGPCNRDGGADDEVMNETGGDQPDGPVDEDTAGDPAEESASFVRYQNSMYRLVSMGGAALIAVIGVTGAVIGWTLDPKPPTQFFLIDGIFAVVLFVWYLLGMRCHLDVADAWVHVATKYGDFRIDRDRVVSVDADRSFYGAIQFSGRPLIIRYRVGEAPGDGDGEGEGERDGEARSKSRRAYGCLPNGAADQQRVVEELQDLLGRPDAAELADLGRAVGGRLAGMTPEGPSDEVRDAVAARLAGMEPEGDVADH